MPAKDRIISSHLKSSHKPPPPLSSKPSPPPKDEFDIGVSSEASAYADLQKNELRRREIREENRRRRANGEKTLRLPPKISASAESTSKKRLDYDIVNNSDQSDDGELEYVGQVVLPFNPLPILATSSVTELDSTGSSLWAELGARGKDKRSGDISRSSVKFAASGTKSETKHETEIRTSKERIDDIKEEEVYSEDELFQPRFSSQASGSKVLSTPSYDEFVQQEEEYSEDELFEPQPTSQDSRSALTEEEYHGEETERPAFPYSSDQSLIGPFPLDDEDTTIAIPASINRFLREYQRTGAAFFYQKYKLGVGGILGDDMGLGKTVQVIAFLSAVMRKSGTSRDISRRKNLIRQRGDLLPPQKWATALIVCPTSLVSNWCRELDTWGFFEFRVWQVETTNEIRASMKGGYLDIVLVSSDLVTRAVDDLKNLPFSVLIVDEAHRLKKPRGLLTLAVKKIKCRSCFALTGTLIQNRMEEMWSILDFVRRGWAGTFKEWKEYVVRPINKGHRHDGNIKEVTESIMRTGEVSQKILPHFYLRRDKRLIANELPLKRDLVVLCPLGSRQVAVYQKVIDSPDVEYILRANDVCDCGSSTIRRKCCHQKSPTGDTINQSILKTFHALGRVANHLALLYQAKDDPPQIREVNRRIFHFCTGEEYDPSIHNAVQAALDPANCGKWTLLETLLKDWRARPQENNKVLIFSQSVRLLKMLAEFMETSLELSSFDCDVFSGEVDKDDRMAMIDRFQDMTSNHFVMLVSTLAGGVGLNLTAANKVVLFDPSWNPANDLQAMDRAFRIGQKRPVDIYRLVGLGTVEELMYERQIYKQQRARQLNDGTFERRIHSGYEGAQNTQDQGELFGVRNIFRFDPRGFVKGNLERVRLAEDRLRQDLIEAEYESDSEDALDDEESGGQLIRYQRRAKDLKRARIYSARPEDDNLLNEIMSDGIQQKTRSDDDVLKKLGISAMLHDRSFRDSPEERKIYEIGLKIMAQRPDLQEMRANEVGKVRIRELSQRGRRSAPKRPKANKLPGDDHDLDEQPWEERFQAGKARNRGKRLAGLSDDE